MNNTATATTTTPDAVGSTIIGAIEEAWAAIARRHPDLPGNIVAITGSGAKGNGWMTRGHWSAARWEVEGATLPEVFISGERISDGARGVLTTLIHEAAHGLAHARGIKETSRQGRWHNRKFVALAQEMGLTTATEAHPSIGFSNTEWNDSLEAEYAEEVAALEAALKGSIPDHFSRLVEFAGVLVWMLQAWGHGFQDPTMVAAATRPVRKSRPRRRKVVLACQCAEVEVFEDQADALSLSCNSCGTDLERAS
jgi:hypothetical protein